MDVQADLCLCYWNITKSRGFNDFAHMIWALTQENLTLLHAPSKGTDQPAHSPSLINGFVICSVENIIDKLALCKISIFKLCSAAEQTGLSLRTGFLVFNETLIYLDI